MPPALKKVIRLDSMPIERANFTEEGYLKDKPILTSTGIFEYANPDGTVRRELRLPEEVFDPESLASYKGMPIIVTHNAGLITRDNVGENSIGTILSEGYRDGSDVRADIIIHDTEQMKRCGLKELSLGYNLDLDETPGVWKGQHYDAIQRHIRINHLALVRDARAGEQARLNIDSRDQYTILKGGKPMKKFKRTRRADGILSPEELAEAIKMYKAKYKNGANDEDDVEESDTQSVEDAIAEIKENRENRDAEGDPVNKQAAMETIAGQDEDIDKLIDIIDTLMAQQAYKDSDDEVIPERTAEDEDEMLEEEEIVEEDEDDLEDEIEVEEDEDDLEDEMIVEEDEDDFEDEPEDEEIIEDEDDFEDEEFEEDEDEDLEEEEIVVDEDDEQEAVLSVRDKKVHEDSIDRIVRERVRIGKIGSKLNMDGLENMKPITAKKAIIKAVKPSIRLDGKSTTYINAMFDCIAADVDRKAKKDTAYQKKQMFHKSRNNKVRTDSAMTARERMIARQQKIKEVK